MRVREGSTGQWGEVPMLPHEQHTVEEVRDMVRWVLAREASAPAQSRHRGLRAVVPSPSPDGTIVLQASYQDSGAPDARALEAFATLHVRSRRVEAEHFSSRGGTRTLESETASLGRFIGSIDSGNHLRYAGMDLHGIDRVSLRISSAGEGGTLSLRTGSTDGPVLAEVEVVPNGEWEAWYETVLAVEDPGGLHDLVVTFRHPEGKPALMNLDRLTFLRPGDAVPEDAVKETEQSGEGESSESDPDAGSSDVGEADAEQTHAEESDGGPAYDESADDGQANGAEPR